MMNLSTVDKDNSPKRIIINNNSQVLKTRRLCTKLNNFAYKDNPIVAIFRRSCQIYFGVFKDLRVLVIIFFRNGSE